MKQDDKIYIAFSKKQPKTIRPVHRWHREMLESCLYFEFKMRTLDAALVKLDEYVQVYVSFERKHLRSQPPRLLKKLNSLKRERPTPKARCTVTRLPKLAMHARARRVISTLGRLTTYSETALRR